MLLYHGSNVVVKNPEIRKPNRNLDFGTGFYTTSDIEQARSFSRIVCNRRGGSQTVSIYDFDYELAKKVSDIKIFLKADEEWFDFVCEKRMGEYRGREYDIIIGPVANDTVYRTFIGYLAGVTSKEEALSRLMQGELSDQITFCTGRALSLLNFSDFEVGYD